MVAERRPNTWVARSVIVMRETEGAIIKLKDIIAAVAAAYPEEAGRVRRKPNRSGRDPLTGTISRELWDAANGYVPGFEFVKSGGEAFPGCYFLQGSASPLWGLPGAVGEPAGAQTPRRCPPGCGGKSGGQTHPVDGAGRPLCGLWPPGQFPELL